MFIGGTSDWSVRSLEDAPFAIYVVWDKNRVVGVAGGKDGLAELFIDVVRDYENKTCRTKEFLVLGVRRLRGANVKTQEFTARIVADDAKDAAPHPDVGKGIVQNTHHHVVVQRVGRKGKSSREEGGRWSCRNWDV